ncbi:MAG: EFR1 family ferrodoxin [Spirochaetes bacterium]|nr:EFR1 family ferrodoxin [Spirochaetota bacterium]
MKKAFIHYFTGTGNTKHAAKILADELNKSQYLVTVINIAEKDSWLKKIEPNCLQVFLYPVYAFVYPKPMLDYIKKLPRGQNNKTAIIANHGMVSDKGGLHTGYEGAGPFFLKRILSKKNYSVFYTDKVGYPENLTVLAPAIDQESQKKVIQNADQLMREKASKILQEKPSFQKYSIFIVIVSYLLGLLYLTIGSKTIGKLFLIDNDCNSCKVCLKSCPTGAIKFFKQKPYWSLKCSGCLRCFNICPKFSINISIIRVVMLILISVLIIPLTVMWYLWVEKNLSLAGVEGLSFIIKSGFFRVTFGIFIYGLLSFVALLMIDKILLLIERIPFLKQLVGFTYSKKFKRYFFS